MVHTNLNTKPHICLDQLYKKIILFAFYHNVCQIQFNDMLESKVFYMKITTRKIGNSVGTIFPKEIAPKFGEEYSVYKVEDTYIL